MLRTRVSPAPRPAAIAQCDLLPAGRVRLASDTRPAASHQTRRNSLLELRMPLPWGSRQHEFALSGRRHAENRSGSRLRRRFAPAISPFSLRACRGGGPRTSRQAPATGPARQARHRERPPHRLATSDPARAHKGEPTSGGQADHGPTIASLPRRSGTPRQRRHRPDSRLDCSKRATRRQATADRAGVPMKCRTLPELMLAVARSASPAIERLDVRAFRRPPTPPHSPAAIDRGRSSPKRLFTDHCGHGVRLKAPFSRKQCRARRHKHSGSEGF
jgi:hypothetical protein